MPDLLAAIILGAVQGITEFLPISSTAHLVLVPWLLGWENPLLHSLTFDVALHMGTLSATMIYFWREWLNLARGGVMSIATRSLRGDPWRKLAWLVVIATIPAALAGLLFESAVESAFRAPWIVASALIAFSLLLAWAEAAGTKRTTLQHMSWLEAVLMGLGQAIAVIPGVSRSGGSMTAGMLAGMTREAAARFSFIMAAPIMAGAGLKKLKDMTELGLDGEAATLMGAGFITSALVGFLVIHLLLRYLQRNTLYVFVGYRILLGIAVLTIVFLRGA